MKAFGYVPYENKIKNLVSKLIGHPHLIRRIQANSIFRMCGSVVGKKILDLGCGDGRFCFEFIRRGAIKVIGIDINESAISTARTISAKFSYSSAHFLVSSAECIPFSNGTFDLAICNCALEHMENDMAVLIEVNRCLKPDGVFVLTVPCNVRRHILPIIELMIKMPKSVKKLIAPEYIEGTKSYIDAIWKLKRERFKEVRNYSLGEIIGQLQKANFHSFEYEYNIKFFAAICWDLITGIKFIHLNRGMSLLFPLMYPISLLDNFLPRVCEGEEIAIKCKKPKSTN